MARPGHSTPERWRGWLRGAARLGSSDEPVFHWLLVALVAQLVALMLVRSDVLTQLLMTISVAIVGLATMPLLPPHGPTRPAQLILCAISVGSVWMSPQSSSVLAYTVGRFAMVLFVVSVAIWTVWHLARAQRVTAETLLGAVSGYLLLGVAFATLFSIIERTAPGSLRAGVVGTDMTDFGNLLYFSFVSLTTVGYGDITPVASAAHLLAIFEAVVGQFYIAAVVARLISLHVSSGKADLTSS